MISLPEGNKESMIDIRSKVETFAIFPSMPAMPVVLVDQVSDIVCIATTPKNYKLKANLKQTIVIESAMLKLII